MRRIGFAPEMVEAIRAGKKTMTYRKTLRPNGDYIVEEGGHSFFEHIDTGLRIRITRNYNVPDIELYAHQFYAQEGFSSPGEFLSYIRKLYGGKLPEHGWGHKFELIVIDELRRVPDEEEARAEYEAECAAAEAQAQAEAEAEARWADQQAKEEEDRHRHEMEE